MPGAKPVEISGTTPLPRRKRCSFWCRGLAQVQTLLASSLGGSRGCAALGRWGDRSAGPSWAEHRSLGDVSGIVATGRYCQNTFLSGYRNKSFQLLLK